MRCARLLLIHIFINMVFISPAISKRIDSLEDLRGEVEKFRSDEKNRSAVASLDRAMEYVNERLTGCYSAEPEMPFAIRAIGNVDFKYATPSTGKDTFCVFLVSPLNRALSVEEARDFLAAGFANIQSDSDYVRPPLTPEQQAEGERNFQELREAVAFQGLVPRAEPIPGPDGRLPPLVYQQHLIRHVDCSNLTAEVMSGYAGSKNSGYIYNDTYIWREITLGGDGLCYFMIEPFMRGLSYSEAVDFAAARSNPMRPPEENWFSKEWVFDGKTFPGKKLSSTVHLTVTGPQKQTFLATSEKVHVPATEEVGKFTYSWAAPDYAALDLQMSINNGPWTPTPPKRVARAGTVVENISLGENYRFRFTPAGGSAVLATLSVTGVEAPLPTFKANPRRIVANGASGETTISWRAPGYEAIDWCGKIDDGPWQCGSLRTLPEGSTIIHVPVNTTYAWRFYPAGSPNQGGAFNLLGEITVEVASNGQPSFSAYPERIVVPSSATSGNTIITWNAPGHASLDWCTKTDDGAWKVGPIAMKPSGSAVVSVLVGMMRSYRFYAAGRYGDCGTANLLGALSVSASH